MSSNFGPDYSLDIERARHRWIEVRHVYTTESSGDHPRVMVDNLGHLHIARDGEDRTEYFTISAEQLVQMLELQTALDKAHENEDAGDRDYIDWTDDWDRYPVDVESTDYDEIQTQYDRNAYEAGL